MSNSVKVGVVGLGRLGALYARYFLGRVANARLAAVCDIQAGLAQSFASEHGVARAFTDYHDLLSDDSVDAVVIVTTTAAHKDIAIDALHLNKPVLCEKPISVELAEAEAVSEAVRSTGGFFQMAFMRRFDNGYASAKCKIDEGLIGTPIVFKSSSRDPYRPSLEYLNPRLSGGLFVDCGIHDIDLARWLVGEISSVYSFGGVLAYPEMAEIGDVDNAITTLQFAGGAIGVIDLSRSGVYGYDIRTEILGTKGTLKVGYLRETPLLVMTKGSVAHDTVPYFMERFEQAYVSQLQDFVDNVLKDRAPSITCDDGVAALKISLAATRSFKERRPVDIERV
jgi:inositol 2-dehydrogenase